MGTTPNLKLPFPELTELADGPDAFNDLATATESYFYNRTLPSGVVRMPSYYWGSGTTYPASPVPGDTWRHTTNGLMIATGTSPGWVPVDTQVGHLKDASGGDSTTTALKTVLSTTVTIPAGLTSDRRIKIEGRVFVEAPTGVGAYIGILNGTSRAFNDSAFSSDVTVLFHDTNVSARSATYSLQVGPTVANQKVTYRAPSLSISIV